MSNLKLKKPNIEFNHPNIEPSTATARFIAEGDRRPNSNKSIPSNFRLPQSFINLLEDDATRTGQNKTVILKAAIAAYNSLDENTKNYWLLESMKMQ